MCNKQQSRQAMLTIFQAGVKAVQGDEAVYQALSQPTAQAIQPVHIIAIGKAAESMYQGAKRHLTDRVLSALLISKQDHFSADVLADEQVVTFEAAHPVPDERSLQAGQALLQHLQALPAHEPCLFLISGGASSLCEVLAEGWRLDDLQQLTTELLAGGYAIHAMNAVRQRLSLIKGGGLWQYLNQRPVQALLISDVEGDDPVSIGSGLLFPPRIDHMPNDLAQHWQARLPTPKSVIVPEHFQWSVVASNQQALQVMRQQAEALGYSVTVVKRFLSGEAQQEAQQCVQALQQCDTDIMLWGGETLVHLPENPGRGGRNQHFALSAALVMQGQPLLLLAAGTDGTDGVSDDAGALVDGGTCARGMAEGGDAKQFLQQADSGAFLALSGDLVNTGPTGTNVMDVVIGMKGDI